MKNELPDGWEWNKLGDVSKNYDSKRIPLKGSDREKREGEYPYCGANGIIDYIDDFIFNGRYILLAEDGGYWNVGDKSAYIMDGKFWVNNHAHILQPASQILCDEFLVRTLNYLDLTKYISGSTRGKLVQRNMNEILIPIPSLETQHKIVAILEKAEETKKLRAQADELTQQFLQNVFLEMFGESSNRDWVMSNIEGVVHPTKGSIRTGPFGSQLLHGEFVEEGIAVLGIDNAVKNEFQWSKRRFISESKYNELKRYTVHPGDVLITIMGTCGRCAIVPDDIPIAINTKHLCCITLDQEKCLPIYLHGYFLQHPIARHYLSLRANGAIMDGLNMRIIKEMPILIPPIELQRKYAAIVQKLNETKQYQQQSSQEHNILFNALMQKAFTGKLLS